MNILPREPLTRKARGAIDQYVVLKGKQKGQYMYVLVRACLEAERMKRVDLYAWLEAKGYRWNNNYWISKSHPGEETRHDH